MDSSARNQFDSKIIDCFHSFSDPIDGVRVTISLNDKEDEVVFETISQIPVAHRMSVEQFLNAPIAALKAIAKSLYKDIRVVR